VIPSRARSVPAKSGNSKEVLTLGTGPTTVSAKSATKWHILYPGLSWGLLGGPGFGPQHGASSSAGRLAMGMLRGCITGLQSRLSLSALQQAAAEGFTSCFFIDNSCIFNPFPSS
jgi:hypothetical protein